jgi:hypothetical protein
MNGRFPNHAGRKRSGRNPPQSGISSRDVLEEYRSRRAEQEPSGTPALRVKTRIGAVAALDSWFRRAAPE